MKTLYSVFSSTFISSINILLQITFQELMAFIEKKGVNLQTRFLGYARKEIKHLGEFIQTLQVRELSKLLGF